MKIFLRLEHHFYERWKLGERRQTIIPSCFDMDAELHSFNGNLLYLRNTTEFTERNLKTPLGRRVCKFFKTSFSDFVRFLRFGIGRILDTREIIVFNGCLVTGGKNRNIFILKNVQQKRKKRNSHSNLSAATLPLLELSLVALKEGKL